MMEEAAHLMEEGKGKERKRLVSHIHLQGNALNDLRPPSRSHVLKAP
jgi:hypothetical protein